MFSAYLHAVRRIASYGGGAASDQLMSEGGPRA
jgi:hypothetical protein